MEVPRRAGWMGTRRGRSEVGNSPPLPHELAGQESAPLGRLAPRPEDAPGASAEVDPHLKTCPRARRARRVRVRRVPPKPLAALGILTLEPYPEPGPVTERKPPSQSPVDV